VELGRSVYHVWTEVQYLASPQGIVTSHAHGLCKYVRCDLHLRSFGVNAADIPFCLDFSASTLLKGLLLCFIKTVLLQYYTLVKSFAIVYFKGSCTLKRGATHEFI